MHFFRSLQAKRRPNNPGFARPIRLRTLEQQEAHGHSNGAVALAFSKH